MSSPTGDSRPPKDYAAALAHHQSTFGAAGHASVLPSSLLVPKNAKMLVKAAFTVKAVPLSSEGTGFKEEEPGSSEGGASLIEEGTRKPEHTAPQTDSPPVKDYESALGNLQSSYGFGGSTLPQVPKH